MSRFKEEINKALDEEKEAETRKNYTFRLKEKLMEDFKLECEKQGRSMASVLEKLIQRYLGE